MERQGARPAGARPGNAPGLADDSPDKYLAAAPKYVEQMYAGARQPLRELHDRFADVLMMIASEAAEDPDLLHGAPYSTPVRRLDEAAAVKHPDLAWRPREGAGDPA